MLGFSILKFQFFITFTHIFFSLVTINIQETFANDTLKSNVKGIFIEFDLKENEDNRKIALQKSYLIGLKRYLDWITISSAKTLDDLIKTIVPSTLVTSYSLENENFSSGKYSALITVNYDLNKIDKLLKEKNIRYYAGNGPKILVLPLMSYNNQLILWDDPNPWYEIWIERPIDANLNNFIIPEGDVEDLITISARDARNLTFEKIKNIAFKYDVKKVIVPFLKIDKKENNLFLTLRCFDGFSKELLNIEIKRKIDKSNFNISLFEVLNSFTSNYDDYWVNDNIKKIASQISIEANLTFDSFKDWLYLKKIINNSEHVNYFNILKLSTKESLTEIKIINKKQFIAELENNNISIQNKNNLWNIKKQF